MRMLWAAQLRGTGNTYGYSTQANRIHEALLALGVTVVESQEEPYDVAVHIVTPERFVPVPGARNVLFTMYEATSIPESWIPKVRQADMLVVPCKNNQDLFKNYFTGPVEVCGLGIDPAMFTYKERRRPGPKEPFRYLWIGAPNPRKGFQLALVSWTNWLRTGRMPKNVQLYLKTSGTVEDKVARFKVAIKRDEKAKTASVDFYEDKFVPADVPDLPGITMDSRNMTDTELVELYHSAHAFLLPSVGEGWGLTLSEAMATGLPCIWTHWGGPRDFADATVGYPLNKWRFGPLKMMNAKKGEDGQVRVFAEHDSYGAIADFGELVAREEQIYADYDRALALGKKASERMHARFKWSDCAERFVQICEKWSTIWESRKERVDVALDA